MAAPLALLATLAQATFRQRGAAELLRAGPLHLKPRLAAPK